MGKKKLSAAEQLNEVFEREFRQTHAVAPSRPDAATELHNLADEMDNRAVELFDYPEGPLVMLGWMLAIGKIRERARKLRSGA